MSARDVARRVGRVEDVGQLRPAMRGRAGDGEAADEAVLAVDRDVRLVTEPWNGNLDLGLRAVCLRGPRLGPLQGPAGIAVLLCELFGLAAHASGILPSLRVTFSASVLRWRGAAMIEASMIWPDIAR